MSYQVLLQGRIAADADPTAVKRQFMALTGQTEIVTERLFSGSPTVIKRKLTQTDAERLAWALRTVGAEASAEPEAAPKLELSLEEPPAPPAAREEPRMEEPEHPAAPAAPAVKSARPVTPLPPPPLEEMYRAVIGPVNTDFYLRHFRRRDSGGPMLAWNGPAVLAQFFWALHRKLWRFAVFGLALGLGVAICAGYFFSFAGNILASHADPIFARLGGVLAGAVAVMAVGAFGNDAYQRRALQLIAETAHISDPARRLAMLAACGGTSQIWRWALGVAVALGAVGVAGVVLTSADPPSATESLSPRAKPLPGSNFLSGRWRCTNQATGRITFWEYAANGGVAFYGENAQETVPLMGPEVPSRWRLQDNVLRWANGWHGSSWSADNTVLDLSRDFMHYSQGNGESVICARP